MTRYIDEKDIYKLLEPTGMAKVHCAQIDELPRADVVPKSEIDFLRASQNLHEAEFNEIKAELELRNAEIETLNVRSEVLKAEVTRKIFVEIEKVLKEYHKSYGLFGEFRTRAIMDALAEIEKKYMKGDVE